MKLVRFKCDESGVFSYLYDGSGTQVAVTAEHAYQDADGKWGPKIQPGIHRCWRSLHQLEGMDKPFETFQIEQLGHANILFHWGNWPQHDSDGCVLTGSHYGLLSGTWAVEGSIPAFESFMTAHYGVNEFELEVV